MTADLDVRARELLAGVDPDLEVCLVLAGAGVPTWTTPQSSLAPLTCGYKYGSAWLREDVPEDVLAWLAELPETDLQPAWV